MKTTSECSKCKYYEIDESDKKKWIITCKLTGKKYVYGQKIPCDEKVER